MAPGPGVAPEVDAGIVEIRDQMMILARFNNNDVTFGIVSYPHLPAQVLPGYCSVACRARF